MFLHVFAACANSIFGTNTFCHQASESDELTQKDACESPSIAHVAWPLTVINGIIIPSTKVTYINRSTNYIYIHMCISLKWGQLASYNWLEAYNCSTSGRPGTFGTSRLPGTTRNGRPSSERPAGWHQRRFCWSKKHETMRKMLINKWICGIPSGNLLEFMVFGVYGKPPFVDNYSS